MSGILDKVNERTQLAGKNRLELLLFKLDHKQTYAINVFKIKEVIRTPKLTIIPNSHPVIIGASHIRGDSIPIIDLNFALGGEKAEKPEDLFVIITEYNQSVQGFLIHGVKRIINTSWSDIHEPPLGVGQAYLTAVTQIDKELVEIIDVEKVLQEISPQSVEVNADLKSEAILKQTKGKTIVICDDSSVARKQIKSCLQQIEVNVVALNNGKEALRKLISMAEENENINDEILMLISDIEMPELDGYKLTQELRNIEKLSKLFIVLHTSMSGIFNENLVAKVGANKFIPKFDANSIVKAVHECLEYRKKNFG